MRAFRALHPVVKIILTIGIPLIMAYFAWVTYSDTHEQTIVSTSRSVFLTCQQDGRWSKTADEEGNTLPEHVVFLQPYGGLEMDLSGAPMSDPSGHPYQIELLFHRCVLRNDGAVPLSDITVNFTAHGYVPRVVPPVTLSALPPELFSTYNFTVTVQSLTPAGPPAVFAIAAAAPLMFYAWPSGTATGKSASDTEPSAVHLGLSGWTQYGMRTSGLMPVDLDAVPAKRSACKYRGVASAPAPPPGHAVSVKITLPLACRNAVWYAPVANP